MSGPAMRSATPRGIWLVTQQEFRIRIRTGRWRWLIGAWVALLVVFTVLLDLTIETGYGYSDDRTLRGVPLFGILMFFVLGMVLVISPALTSQSINGDRERGTLATLQVTKLKPAEIALGKLLAGWGVGLVMLALTLPCTAYAMAKGGITIDRVAAVYGVVALLIGVVCAISQMLSALLARSITSALLSYVSVAALCVGTVIAFLLIYPFATEEQQIPNGDGTYYTDSVERTDLTWWILAPNPFVVLADSAPRVPPRTTVTGDTIYVDDYDPLSATGRLVRELRRPPVYSYSVDTVNEAPPPVWPWGLGINVLVGLVSVVVTVRRLRTPSRTLARGVRIA